MYCGVCMYNVLCVCVCVSGCLSVPLGKYSCAHANAHIWKTSDSFGCPSLVSSYSRKNLSCFPGYLTMSFQDFHVCLRAWQRSLQITSTCHCNGFYVDSVDLNIGHHTLILSPFGRSYLNSPGTSRFIQGWLNQSTCWKPSLQEKNQFVDLHTL